MKGDFNNKYKMDENDITTILLGIVATIAVIGLIVGNTNITGFASKSADKTNTDNTPCARICTMTCTPSAILSFPGAEGLSVHDCILRCMNARCGQTAKAGKCAAFAKDGCCNIFAAPGQDPDCAPVCQPAGTCIDDPITCCNYCGPACGYAFDPYGCGSNKCL